MIVGDAIRDWLQGLVDEAVFPYTSSFQPMAHDRTQPALRYLWLARNCLATNKMFGGKTKVECGLNWYEYGRLTADKLRTPLSIAFAFVATHNHFVLDRGGKVFNRSAPVIKLPADATEDDHIALLGILNSSTACFWMRQTFHDKGGGGIGGGLATEEWEHFREFTGTGLLKFPLPASRPLTLTLTQKLQAASDTQATLAPAAVISRWAAGASTHSAPQNLPPLKQALEDAAATWQALRRDRIALQEELDWQCYRLYGLIDSDLTISGSVPPIALGERAFEIVLARRVASGELKTTWFIRHGSTPLIEIPSHWPADYSSLIQKRLDAIAANPNIALIEQPEYKRRWNTQPWSEQATVALESFLLGRLERLFDFDGRMNDAGTPTQSLPQTLVSLGDIANAVRLDPLFHAAAEVFTDDVGFDRLRLVTSLVEAQSVPLLPVLRYKDTGLRKRREWEETWNLQRKEDAIDARTALAPEHPEYLTAPQAVEKKRKDVGDIAVPPKYTSADFLKTHYWRLRGKLDVPKERFVSFPGVTGPDNTSVIAWAGLDHFQLAKAVGDFYGLVQTDYGGSNDSRLLPLLANLAELLPWVRQWHPETIAAYGGGPAEFYDQFVQEEVSARGLPRGSILVWQPPAAVRGKRAAQKATEKKPAEKAVKKARKAGTANNVGRSKKRSPELPS